MLLLNSGRQSVSSFVTQLLACGSCCRCNESFLVYTSYMQIFRCAVRLEWVLGFRHLFHVIFTFSKFLIAFFAIKLKYFCKVLSLFHTQVPIERIINAFYFYGNPFVILFLFLVNNCEVANAISLVNYCSCLHLNNFFCFFFKVFATI